MQQDYSVADEILKLKKLHDDGIISKEEFEIQKQKLFSSQNDYSDQSKNKSGHSNVVQNKQQSICCPKCGSTSVATGARGINFTTGIIGASNTVNRCANCGHMWKPTILDNTTNPVYDPNTTKGLGYLWLGFIGIIILLIIINLISH